MSTGRTRLSREKIAEAALAIADSEGFEAVSMRRVAQELDAGAMSLYHYVRTKDDLVAAMDDALMNQVVLPSLPKPWKRAILAIASRTYAVFARHPWALTSLMSAPPGIGSMRHMEQCLDALAETRLSSKQKITLLETIDDFVFGHALRASAADRPATPADLDFAAAQLATGAFPRVAEVFGKGRVYGARNRFETAVMALLDGFGDP